MARTGTLWAATGFLWVHCRIATALAETVRSAITPGCASGYESRDGGGNVLGPSRIYGRSVGTDRVVPPPSGVCDAAHSRRPLTL